MEHQESFLTPRKIFQNAFNRSAMQGALGSPAIVGACTPTSLPRNAGGNRFNLLPVMHTPPSRYVNGRVMNPFDAHLADRLHLPMICSPSLFHRPSTPHGASIQFEWTIEDVSSLGPANVEAHETQFIENSDPVLEAKVQAAISSYFNEQNIVPSPADHPLRNQKIILPQGSSCFTSKSVPRTKARRNRRDGVCQTVLTFPPNLSKEVEDTLKTFFTFHEDQQQRHDERKSSLDDSSTNIDHEARDASLRRKLFNHSISSHGSIESPDSSIDHLRLQSLSPAPATPEVSKDAVQDLKRSRYFGSQEFVCPGNISLSPVSERSRDDGSFGLLSPITKSTRSSSPEQQSPEAYAELDAIYRSTPEKSKAPTHHLSMELGRSFISDMEKSDEWPETELSYDDTMQMSTRSLELSGVNHHRNTTLRHTAKQNSKSRKNLSHSFLMYSEGEDRMEESSLEKQSDNTITVGTPAVPEKALNRKTDGVNFYRTDSGFNEGNQTYDPSDISMLSESGAPIPRTPGKFLSNGAVGYLARDCSIRL